MDTSNVVNKSIYSIAYFGTYASGKLLAGERMGFPCTATVPTWFTDSPTTCPIPCWYPALKPTTGAAGCNLHSAGTVCQLGICRRCHRRLECRRQAGLRCHRLTAYHVITDWTPVALAW